MNDSGMGDNHRLRAIEPGDENRRATLLALADSANGA